MLWGALADRTDSLRLLVSIAQHLGAKGLEDYEPASEQIAAIEDPVKVTAAQGTDERRLQVQQFMAATGGG